MVMCDFQWLQNVKQIPLFSLKFDLQFAQICFSNQAFQIFFSGAAICQKCWPLMTLAIKILDRALQGKNGEFLLFYILQFIIVSSLNCNFYILTVYTLQV